MTTYYIRSGGNNANAGTSTGAAWLTFQYGLDHIGHGDTLDVEAGISFANGGTTFNVPFIAGGTNTIADLKTVRSSAYASLPDARVTESDASNMFKLVGSGSNHVLGTSGNSPKWWKFDGMEITNSGTTFNNGAIIIGGAFTPSSGPTAYGDQFEFTRCYLHPQEHGTSNYMRTSQVGMWWNAGEVNVNKCLITGYYGIYGNAARFYPVTVNATTDIITWDSLSVTEWYATSTLIAHSTGTLPGGLSGDPTYYWPVGTRNVTNAVTNGTTTITSATITFTSGDTGKQFMLTDGTNYLTGRLTFVNSTTATMSAAASWSSSGNTFSIFDNATTLKLSTTKYGPPVNITSAGSGTISLVIPEAINSGAFWSNAGGPYYLDDNFLSANYNPVFLGAGENGSPNEGTIASGATDTAFTLSNTTLIEPGVLMSVETHSTSWSTALGFNWLCDADDTTDTFSIQSPYTTHELLDNDVMICTLSTDYTDTRVPLAGSNLLGPPQRYYVINATSTTFQLSTTRGGSAVNIGASGSFYIGMAGHKWAVGEVATVNHGTGAVTLNWLVRFEGYNQTVIQQPPFTHVYSTAYPEVGGVAKWLGYNVSDFNITHCTLDLDLTSADYVYDRTGAHPKAYVEVKDMDTALWEGNVFQGWPSGIAMTLSNQNGTSPWVNIKDVMIRSNFLKNFSILSFNQLSSSPPSYHGENITITNNLCIGPATYGRYGGPAYFLYGIMGGQGTPVTATHNTIINQQDVDGGALISTSGLPQPFIGSGGDVWKDNIMFWNRNGVLGTPFSTYYPNVVEDNNLIVDHPVWTVGTNPWPNFPNSIYCASMADVDFAGGGTGTDVEDWRLLSSSPGYNAASDSGDIGVDIDVLLEALAGGGGGPEPPDEVIVRANLGMTVL